ncbi:MAG TPA: hypothetical protein VF779_17345 [Pyrinomonadaceae bacterium]
MLRKSFNAALILLAAIFAFMLSVAVQGQIAQQTGETTQVSDPVFHDYKGVTLSMTMNDVHQKLGAPKESGGGQDFYQASEKEAIQIFYRNEKVKAIVVTYLGEGNGAPDCKAVLGTNETPTADGSIYKVVRYPKAGYWVSYNRTGGDAPMVVVTMQKITP